MTGLNHVNRHTGSHTSQVLLLSVHQRVHAAVRALGHQHNTGTAQRTEHQILVAVRSNGLLLNNPTAAHRVHRRTTTTGLVLNLSKSRSLRAATQQKHRHNSGNAQTQNQESNPVIQGNTDEEENQKGTQSRQTQNPTDIRVGLLGHLVDLLHLGESARSAFLLLFLLFALICHDSSSAGSSAAPRSASNAHGTIVT